ncbi:MAG: hypothetical protein ACRDFS_03605 [Chloroflexota bacterium]
MPKKKRSQQRRPRGATPVPEQRAKSKIPAIISAAILATLGALVALYLTGHLSPKHPTVDGIPCGGGAVIYHIHQHLALYDRGRAVPLPADIGIPGGDFAPCFYWIHVHENDPGIIHVESPIHKTFTLGNFFDIWRVTKSSSQPNENGFLQDIQRATPRGNVTAFVDDKRWHGSYRGIPLRKHAVITFEIGRPVVRPKPFQNWRGQ